MTPKLRAALLAAADHIEQNPDQHDFMSGMVPYSQDGSCGCAIAWVGYFAGRKGSGYSRLARDLFGKDTEELHALFYQPYVDGGPSDDNSYTAAPAHVVAKNLRRYAEADL